MFRYLCSIISLLFVTISPCVGDIVAKTYVDAVRGNVQTAIDNKAANSNYTQNMVLQTDGSGNVVATTVGTDLLADGAIETMHLTDGAVTNADLAGMIDIKKLNLGTLPTSGKHMMIWNAETQKYVFEKYVEKLPLQCPAGQYDIGFEQCVDPTTDGTVYGYIAFDGANIDGSGYGLTENGTWGATFSYGKVKGMAACNNKPGTHAQSTNENFEQSNDGQYCWCKMTYPVVSRWVLSWDRGSAPFCSENCAYNCVYNVGFVADMRSGVFGAVDN